jgi:biotin synthase
MLPAPRHDWTDTEISALYELKLFDLMDRARAVHRAHWPDGAVQVSTLLSIKTGACPEDCAYCPQSVHFDTGLKAERLLPLAQVIEAAQAAKDAGATRFCMGAAWRSPRGKDLERVAMMVSAVKELGLETCVTLGMLEPQQAHTLKQAGLDYYNHNLDTSPDYYEKIITTRTYADRLDTLQAVRAADIRVCSGGIVGMGETRTDRVQFLQQLANLPVHPESVPINQLIAVAGTPLGEVAPLEEFEFLRTIAIARLLMPKSYVRLSAGRESMNDALQAWCFYAGANSIFYGDKLLTQGNPEAAADRALLARLGLHIEQPVAATMDHAAA